MKKFLDEHRFSHATVGVNGESRRARRERVVTEELQMFESVPRAGEARSISPFALP